MNSNSDNPGIGKNFQKEVANWFKKQSGKEFKLENKIYIGYPPKLHSFDITSEDETIVCECKCYTWTESGNVPSAKMGFVNEAVFYLSFLQADVERLVVMMKATHSKRKETLAEYYFRTNHHLLNGVKVMEYDMASATMKNINGN